MFLSACLNEERVRRRFALRLVVVLAHHLPTCKHKSILYDSPSLPPSPLTLVYAGLGLHDPVSEETGSWKKCSTVQLNGTVKKKSHSSGEMEEYQFLVEFAV